MCFDLSSFFDLSFFSHREFIEKYAYPWLALKELESYLSDYSVPFSKNLSISPQAYLINPDGIFLGEGSIVEPGAYIQGPCVFGRNTVIRHGAYIRGNVLAGDDCVIGHTTELKNCIFLNGVHAAHFAYLGDSIVGNHVNLGAGVKCANLRLDRQPIKILFHGERIDTGMRKFGALIGDKTQIGCNVVINPGTLIGKNSISNPGLVLDGFLKPESIAKSSNKPLISLR